MSSLAIVRAARASSTLRGIALKRTEDKGTERSSRAHPSTSFQPYLICPCLRGALRSEVLRLQTAFNFAVGLRRVKILRYSIDYFQSALVKCSAQNTLDVLQFGGRADGHVKVYGRHLHCVVEIARIERVDDIVREFAEEHEISGRIGDALLEALREKAGWSVDG